MSHNRDYWLQREQMWALDRVAGELQQQRRSQQVQAALAEVLFDAENVVQKLTVLAAHDRFSAGVMASVNQRMCLKVTTESFHTIEAKRAWSAAMDALNGLWLSVANDPSLGPRALAVLAAADERKQWRAFLTADPEARARELDGMVVKAVQSRKIAKQFTLLSFAFLLLTAVGFVMMALLSAVVEMPKEIVELVTVITTLVVVIAPLVGLVAAISFLSSRSSITMSEQKAAEFRVQLARYEGFRTRPDGGQLLDEVARNHPNLVTVVESG